MEEKKAKESKVNRIQSTALISGIMDRFYEDARKSKYVCWCVGACPYEILNGAGIARFQTENLASRISSRQEQVPYIEYAEAHGLGSEVCSYAKINIGQALMMVEGREEELIPERLRVKRPDMVIALNTCPTMIQWAKALVDIFHVPYYFIDAPFFHDEEKGWDRNIAYVKEQLLDGVTDEWIKSVDSLGYDGKAIIAERDALLAKYAG